MIAAVPIRRESGPRLLFGCIAVNIRRLRALLKEDHLVTLRGLTWNFLPISQLFCDFMHVATEMKLSVAASRTSVRSAAARAVGYSLRQPSSVR